MAGAIIISHWLKIGARAPSETSQGISSSEFDRKTQREDDPVQPETSEEGKKWYDFYVCATRPLKRYHICVSITRVILGVIVQKNVIDISVDKNPGL